MDNPRLVEIMADLLAETRQFRQESNANFAELKERVARLEEQQIKTNLALNELRLSNMRLAERIEDIVQLDQRVRVLENIVLPKAS